MRSVEQVLGHYRGRKASDYEKSRKVHPTWVREDRAVRQALTGVPRGATVLDIPVGTGRFLGLYHELGLHAIGMDVSADMLAEARAKREGAELYLGDVRHIPLVEGSVEVAVCVRLFYWLNELEAARAFDELLRVARERIVLTVKLSRQPIERASGTIVHVSSFWNALTRKLRRRQRVILSRERGAVFYVLEEYSCR